MLNELFLIILLKLKIKMMDKIKYCDIMSLGFKEEKCHDDVYFAEFGYQYKIFTLKLSKRVVVDWEQSTQLAEVLTCDKDGNVLNRLKIRSLLHLKEVVSIFVKNK